MKKIISYSIYKAPETWEVSQNTSFAKYTSGLVENINTFRNFYPDWEIQIYHNEELDNSIIKDLTQENIKFILMKDKNINSMQWRFLPHDGADVDFFIVRDVDSRFTEREKVSVMEWLESGKSLHIMRDHPHHTYDIMGGMWGMKKNTELNMENSIKDYNKSKNYDPNNHWYDKWWDMNFLRDVIYPKFKDDSFINASYHAIEKWAKPFSHQLEERKFVGEIYLENNQREYHYTLL